MSIESMSKVYTKKRVKNRKLLAEINKSPCIICGKKSDACHIKTKGSGGDDTNDNLLSMCRSHHIESHQIGWYRFTERHPAVAIALTARGWGLTNEFGIWKLRRIPQI